MKFKNYIEVQSGIKDSANSPGTLDQVLTSTATGVAWVDPSTISAEAATLVVIECKNTSGATITKGTPVYQTGTVGATDVIEIAPADALISAGKQPAIGLLQTTLNNNGFGKVVITGEFLNFTTDPIDGVTPTTGDKVFLKSGGGLTLTKPTGEGNGIQNLGLIGKVSGGNAGSITVSSIMRTNDVPNLPTGKIWVGDGNTIVSDTVFLDEPNGRMGIGTTSPADKLEVYNNGGDVAIRIHEDAGTHEARLHLRRGGSDWELINNNNFTIESEGSEKFRITPTGNVGIGTTSPENKLHVQQSALYTGIQTTAGIRVKSDGGSAIGNYHGTIALSRGTGSVAISAVQEATDSDVMGMAFFTHPSTTGGDAAVEQMRIDQNGNVGIGTTSPGTKLEVNGDIGIGRVAGGYTFRETVGGSERASIKSNATNELIFSYGASTEAMRIDDTGNVGIGTTSPGVNFQVGDGTTDTSSKFYHNDNTYTQVSGYGLYFSRLSSYIRPVFDGTQDLYFGNINRTWKSIQFDATTITFDNNSSEAMRITSSGNVGIGTTSPSSKLHVNYEDAESVLTISRGGTNLSAGTAIGTIQFNADYQGSPISYGSIDMYANSLSGVRSSLDFNVKSTSGGIQTGLTVQGNSGTPRVGIGTTSPSHLLTLETASSPGLKIKDTTQGATLLAFSQDSNSHIGTYSSHPLVFDTNSAERMRIDSSGNVGIGTSSPGYELSVNGNIEAGKNVFQDIGSRGGYIMRPWGADYLNSTTNVHTGAIKIILPTTSNMDDMIKFTVDIYQYQLNESTSIDIAGYIYQSPGNNTWLNCTTIVNTKESSENYTVRYGDDGTNHCVWIGELNSTWNFPQIIVRDFFGGYLTDTNQYLGEWDIDFEATAFENVNTTQSNNFPLSSGGVDGGFLPLSAGSSYPLTDTLFGTNTSMSGNGTYAGSMNLGNGGGTGEKHLTIGNGSTGNGYRYIDLVGDTTYTDYGLRIIRGNSGANTSSQIVHRGTGDFSLQTTEAGKMRFVTANSERMRITSTGDIGIGTSSPSEKLDVQGAIAVNGTRMFSTIGSTSYIWNNTDNLYVVDDTGNNVQLAIKDNGNVGIGTASPGSKLEISSTSDALLELNGGVTANPYMLFAQNGTRRAFIQYVNGGLLSLASEYGDIRFMTGTGGADTEKMRIKDDGNVGIGTTNPGARLDVDKSAIIGSESTANSTTNIENVLKVKGKNNYSDGTTWYGDYGQILLSATNNMTSSARQFLITNALDNNKFAIIRSTDWSTPPLTNSTATGVNSGTADFVIDNVGNVGIGTTSNSADETNNGVPKLQVNTTTAVLGEFPLAARFTTASDAGDNSGVSVLINSGNDRGLMISAGRAVSNRARATLNLVQYDGNELVDGITLYQPNTASGGATTGTNVGIGTTSPGAKLEVNGNVAINSTGLTEGFQWFNDTNEIFSLEDTAGAGELLLLSSNSVKVKLNANGSSYLNGGNVGIGTTNPVEKLHIENTSGANIILNSNTSAANNGIYMSEGSSSTPTQNGAYFYYDSAANAVKLDTGTSSLSTKLTVSRDSGNVGIGNTAPVNGKLVVTSGVDGPLNTVRIQHTRDDANVSTNALEIDMNLSGADTTTADRTNKGMHVDLDSSADGDASNEHRIHGIGSTVNFTGFSDIVRAGNFYAESGNITEKTAQLVGVYGQAVHDANSVNGGVSNMFGTIGHSDIQDLGDVDNAFGGYFLVTAGPTRGNADIGVTKGVEGEIQIDKASTINYGDMIGVSSIIDNNEGTVPNFGNQYLFKGDYQGDKGSNAYGIYVEGDKHYFDGNVGIGTTSPSHKLEVGLTSPVALTSQPAIPLMISNNGNTVDGRVLLQVKHDTVNTAGAIAAGYQMTAAAVTSGTASYYDSLIFLESAGSGSETVHSAPKNIEFYVNNYNTAAGAGTSYQALGNLAFELQADGDAIFYDNVGIGTTSPGSKIHVNGTSERILIGDSSAGENWIDGQDLGGFAFKTHYNLQEKTGMYAVGMLHGSGSDYIPHLHFKTSSTTRLAIDNNGNVGIGTASPDVKLQINHTGGNNGIRIISPNDVNGFLQFGDSDDDNVGRIVYGHSNDSMQFVTNDAERMRITSTGNVGIGTTSPGAKLDVVGNGNAIQIRRSNGFASIKAHSDNGGNLILDSDSSGSVFINNYVNRPVYIATGGGNVGIGTTSPSDKLHVNGTVRSQAPATSDWALLGYNSAGSAASGLWFDNGDGELLLRDDSGNLNIRLRSDTSSYINGGNLGLGTTSPAQKLTVNSGRMLVSNTTTPIYIKAGSTYKSWVHHIGGSDGYIFAPSTADNGETWDWANQTKLGANGVVTAKNFQLSSDERFKNNIKDIKDIKVEAAFKSFEMESSPGEKRYGVVAQELEKTNPELVETDHEGFKSVKYIDLLIAKIAELEARLEKLEK